jgi:hypothetical protein
MSGQIIYTPATGADWATAWEQAEYTRKGKMGLSLTEYFTGTIPQVASGSWAEVAGSIYKWTSDDTISGTPTSGVLNFIKLVPSGTGVSSIVTPTWDMNPPAWSAVYQGKYYGTSRCIGGCYYDGTNYLLKWVQDRRDIGPYTEWITATMGFVPSGDTWGAGLAEPRGLTLQFNSNPLITGDGVYLQVFAQDNDIVTGLYIETTSATNSTVVTFTLQRINVDETVNNMAEVELACTGTTNASGNDTSVSYPIIDNENYIYAVYVRTTTGTVTGSFGKIKVSVTRIRR